MMISQGTALDADKLTDDEWRLPRQTRRGFTKLDAKYFLPFFTRKFTRQVSYISHFTLPSPVRQVNIQIMDNEGKRR